MMTVDTELLPQNVSKLDSVNEEKTPHHQGGRVLEVDYQQKISQ